MVKLIYLKYDILCGDHMKTHSATVSSKGQITLPKKYREGYHLLEGEEVLILPTDDGILIKHKKTHLRGMLAGKIDFKEFEKELKALRKEWIL
jgi:AbrB family looped-hinge helix DNA binding protein